MRNRYPGFCYRCGRHVAPGQGFFEKIHPENRLPNGPKWRVQCLDCCATHRREKAMKRKKRREEECND
jgi:hypothetical protein